MMVRALEQDGSYKNQHTEYHKNTLSAKLWALHYTYNF